MARSTYIYAVTHPGQVPPLATFTVKHELRTALKRWEGTAGVLSQIKIWRMDDGIHGMIAEMNVDDVLNGR